jgi:adenylate kinase
MILIFLGPPGSGKGTQAKILAEKKGLPHISLGDILREEVRAASEIGLKAKSFMDLGNLVPDELSIELTRQRISRGDCQKGFIIDGFPRSMGQAEALAKMFAERRLKLDRVIYFKIDEAEVVKRLSGRRSCKNCGAVYHTVSKPPKVEGKCDLCGGDLSLRLDDQPEVIKTRFEVYARTTQPLIDYYKQQGVLLEIDANQPIEQVFQQLVKV